MPDAHLRAAAPDGRSAMRAFRFEVDTAELERALRKLGAERSGVILAKSAYEAGQLVEANIKRRAPNSGESRSSNRKKNHKGKLYPFKLSEDVLVKEAKIDHRGVLVRVVSLPYYTGMVERGTSKQPPQPYIRKAAADSETEAQNHFTDGVKKMVEAAFR